MKTLLWYVRSQVFQPETSAKLKIVLTDRKQERSGPNAYRDLYPVTVDELALLLSDPELYLEVWSKERSQLFPVKRFYSKPGVAASTRQPAIIDAIFCTDGELEVSERPRPELVVYKGKGDEIPSHLNFAITREQMEDRFEGRKKAELNNWKQANISALKEANVETKPKPTTNWKLCVKYYLAKLWIAEILERHGLVEEIRDLKVHQETDTEIFISRKVAHEIINRACDKNEAKCKCLEFKIFLGEREKPFFEYPIPATVLSKFPAPIVDLKTRKVLNREDLEPTVKMKVKEFSLVDQDEQNSTPAPVVDPRNKWRYLFGSSDKRAKQILAELLDECGQKDWAEKFGLNDPKTDRVDLPILPSVAMALRSKMLLENKQTLFFEIRRKATKEKFEAFFTSPPPKKGFSVTITKETQELFSFTGT